MARRPVFAPLSESDQLVEELGFEFDWNSGFAVTQKKKNVLALHKAASREGLDPLLEISTKSEIALGRHLSAFSLEIESDVGSISLEAAFQGSKVFAHGGPYHDLYRTKSRQAKKDERIRSSGNLIEFNFFGEHWPSTPITGFYDWLYLKALQPHQNFLKCLFQYHGFTDIEFNPAKSINCQARSCALLVSLLARGQLDDSLHSQRTFLSIVEDYVKRKEDLEIA